MQEDNKQNDWIPYEDDGNFLREAFEKYLFYWKWFVLGLVLAMAGAYWYMLNTPPLYQVSTTILIDESN